MTTKYYHFFVFNSLEESIRAIQIINSINYLGKNLTAAHLYGPLVY